MAEYPIRFELHVDDRDKLIGQIEGNSGITPSALDIAAGRGALKLEADAARDTGPVASVTPDQVAQEVQIPLPVKELGLSL